MKDVFPFSFFDKIWIHLHVYSLNSIHLNDSEKMTFTFPFGKFAFKWMLVGLCNDMDTSYIYTTKKLFDFLGIY